MVFPWRKRNEGFEWRTYVRTTILVRRHERRKRAEDVKAAAVFGVKQAGLKSADGAAVALRKAQAGSLAALKWSGARVAVGARKSAAGLAKSAGFVANAAGRGAARAKVGLQKGGAALAPKMAAAGSAARAGVGKVAEKLEPGIAPLRQPGLQLAIKLIAGVAAVGALIRAGQFGLDRNVLTAALTATAALFLLLITREPGGWSPRWARAGDVLASAVQRVPGLSRMSSRGITLSVLGIAAIVAAAVWTRHSPRPSWPHFASLTGSEFASLTGSESGRHAKEQASSNAKQSPRDPALIEGYATAQSGDTLRLASKTVRLQGVEAPDRLQTCMKLGVKRWDCAASAREGLSRLVRGKRVTCRIADGDEAGPASGRCSAGGTDLGSDLVAKGHVFAQSGLFATYASEESTAKAAKLGLWAGDALRPADWRAVRWEEAKRQAPDGCPIKGQVFRKSGKVYMLPWSPDYDRARVDKGQGERWFCSESEAVSAGWKPL